MREFIRQHWIAYVVGAVCAVLLGLGVSFFLGAKWSTPTEVRQERVDAEQDRQEEIDTLQRDEASK